MSTDNGGKAELILAAQQIKRPQATFGATDKVTVEHIRNGKVIYTDEENNHDKDTN